MRHFFVKRKINKPYLLICTRRKRRECIICLRKFKYFELKKNITCLPCHKTHIFHKECIKKWFTFSNGTCPYCSQQTPNYHVVYDE